MSGRRRGPVAAGVRLLLAAAELPYAAAVRWRNRRYDHGRAEVHSAGVPVVSVGNLTLGGTGKTPMVEWIARLLRAEGVRVSLVSRGYAAVEEGRNDEAMELELALPDVPHVQDPDRVAAARVAVEELATQLIVMDDGFQHRRLARDLDVVLLDATEPLGFGHVFPRGTLREPASGLARADVVVLTRAGMLEETQRDALRERAARLAPGALWCEADHSAEGLVNSGGATRVVEETSAGKVAAFCGIANPGGFRHTLRTMGVEPAAWRGFPDHHHYSREDVDWLTRWAGEVGAETLLCTRKDLVKIGATSLGGVPLWAVAVRQSFLKGQEEFSERLRELARRVPPDEEE